MQERQNIRDRDAHRSGAQRSGDEASAPPHAVLGLQGRIGNAATVRLLSKATAKPRQRTLQRFNAAEHRALGDLALDVRFRLPAGTMFQDLQLTFGDWIALGDYFEDIAEIKRLLKPGASRDTAGQVYYAVLVKIRPQDAAERKKVLEAYKNAELWTRLTSMPWSGGTCSSRAATSSISQTR